MNILCIGPAYPLRGGIANFNMSLCRAFNRSGHHASIQSFSLQYPGFLFPGKTQYEGGPAPGDLKIHSGINSINPFSWWKTAGFIRKKNPDLIILHHWMPFIAVGLASIVRRVRRRTRVPVIAITHNVIPHEKHPFWKVLTTRLLKRCDGFITLSSSVLDDLDLFTENPHRIFIPHPVYEIFGEAVERDEAADKLGLDPAEKYLLFFGYIRKYKGLDLMLRAFAACCESFPDLKLIVAGEFYSGKQEYLDLINELNLEDRVIIRDEFIPADEVKYYFSLADLVTQPYLSATQSGVTQIAYHFEAPMLVTNVGGLAEFVPDGKVGYVTDVSDKAISEAIVDFFSSGRSGDFRQALKTEKKRFSWEAMTSAITEMAGRLKQGQDY